MKIFMALSLIILSQVALAEILTLNGTLPVGTQIKATRTYSTNNKIPLLCGKYDMGRNGGTVWYPKSMSDSVNASVTNDHYAIKIDLDKKTGGVCDWGANDVKLEFTFKHKDGKAASRSDYIKTIPGSTDNVSGMTLDCYREVAYLVWCKLGDKLNPALSLNPDHYDGRPIVFNITYNETERQ